MTRSYSLRMSALLVLAVLVAAGVPSPSPAADKPPAVGDKAEDFELPDLDGTKTKLSKLTAGGPVVLVVLRGYPGYQCPICSRQVAEFLGKADAFKKAKARVVFVYPGPAVKLKDRAKEFTKGKDYPAHFSFLLDPDYAFTKAYGLRWAAKNETAYPSTFVIDAKQMVTLARVSKTHGGRVKVGEALEALGSK